MYIYYSRTFQYFGDITDTSVQSEQRESSVAQ